MRSTLLLFQKKKKETKQLQTVNCRILKKKKKMFNTVRFGPFAAFRWKETISILLYYTECIQNTRARRR